MTEFSIYFQLGWEHILSKTAIDHLLFLLLLTAPFDWKSTKKLIWMVTAFTLGHACTLLFSPFIPDIIPSHWIEFIISLSIFIMAVHLLWQYRKGATQFKSTYWIVFGFGLVHGMGFAGYFSSLLGKGSAVILPLFAFNLGVEAGQLIAVSVIFALQFLMIKLLPQVTKRFWMPLLAVIGLLMSLNLIFENFPL